MNFNKINWSVVTKKDFENFINTPNPYVSGFPSRNQWTFDDNLRAAIISKDQTAHGGYVDFLTGYLVEGDIIKFNFDYVALESRIRVLVDFHATNPKPAGSVVYQSDHAINDCFENVNRKFVVTESGYYKINIGSFSDDSNVLYLRDVLVEVETKNTSKDYTLLNKTMQESDVVSGSNDRGSWRKFPDGTMQQWGRKSVSATTAPFGPIHYFDTDQTDFPIPFLEPPKNIQVTLRDTNFFSGTYEYANENRISRFLIYCPIAKTDRSLSVDWFAEGKWK